MNIAILGFGVVGRGAYETIKNSDCGLTVKRILDLRVPLGMEDVVTTDIADILADDSIEAVAEAIGGLHPAYEFICRAIDAGKHVVSANKHLICHYYRDLHERAKERGVELRFTPAVGGGIPWLHNLRRITRCDRILSLSGIMNGTTNYILDSMVSRGIDFDEALKEAQALGYAEADPTADIDGLDVQRKCAISASLAFGAVLRDTDVPTFGIRRITKADVARFDAMGYVCKLMAFAEAKDGRVSACVEPYLMPKSATEGSVHTNFNCITLVGERVGRLSFIGQGAGSDPTGMALVEDLIDVTTGNAKTPVSLDDATIDGTIHPHNYYIRTSLALSENIILHRLQQAVITHPMTPAEIHALYREIADKDPAAFVAGMDAGDAAAAALR